MRFRYPNLAEVVKHFSATELKWWMEAEEQRWEGRWKHPVSALSSLVTLASGVAPVGGSLAISCCTYKGALNNTANSTRRGSSLDLSQKVEKRSGVVLKGQPLGNS